MKTTWPFLTGGLFAALIIHAQDELPRRVVVAHRMEADLADIGNSLTLFEREEIQLMGGFFLQDILRWAPGVGIVRTGGPGQDSKFYLRGTEPRHTLVLVDGVELRNPNSPDGFDIVHLPIGDIERIEVLRGPQSPLYGADALGGVLNIVTRKGDGDLAGAVQTSLGSYETLGGSFVISGRKNRLNYSMHTSVFESESFSVATSGIEGDPYENHSTSLVLGYEMSDAVDLQFTVRLLDTKTHFDNAASIDASNYFAEQKDAIYRLGLVRKGDNGQSLDRIAVSYKDFQRDNTASGTEHFASQTRKAEWQRTLTFDDDLRLLAGVEYLEEKGQQNLDYGFGGTAIRDTLYTTSGFLQVRKAVSDKLMLDLGLRVDDSRAWDTEATWRVVASHRLGVATRLKGSVGTGFCAPNVYYLAYAQDRYTLQPEESVGFDIGIERQLLEGLATFSVTCFHNDIDNLFGWNAAYKVVNVNEVKTNGMETSFAWMPDDEWRLLLDWTHLQSEDRFTGKRLDFRPEDQLAARLFWTPSDKKYQVFVGVRHRSVFYNAYIDSATWTTYNNGEGNPSSSGATWEGAIRYQISDAASVFLRAEDLFNQKLEEMRDYNGNPFLAPGRIFHAGLNWSF